MYKGFTKATLGLIGAALLSSSAFAAGPTLGQLPNVIIQKTDKNGAVDPGFGATPATGIYLYTDTFALTTYVTFDGDNDMDVDAADWANVSWEFQETDTFGAVQQTIAIGADVLTDASVGKSGAAPVYADIVGSGRLDVNAVGELDFLNVALTPDPTVSGIGDPTGTLDTFTQTDTAVINLYVASSLVPGSTADKSFFVYTTADNALSPVDALTFTSNIYNPEACYDGDFSGWFNTAAFPTAPVTQTPSSLTGSAESAVGGTFPVTGATTTLEGFSPASSTPGVVGWASMRRDGELDTKFVNVADNETLLMARWTVSADPATQAAAATQPLAASVGSANIRVRLGEVNSVGGNGQSVDAWLDGGSNAITGASEVIRTYHFVKKGGNYDTVEGLDDAAAPITPTPNTNNPWLADDDQPVRVGYAFEMIDTVGSTVPSAFGNPARDWGYSIEKLEVFSTTRDDLSGGTVLLNQGEAAFTTADGSTPPTSNYTGFDLTSWDYREELGVAASRVSASPNEVDNTNTNYNGTLNWAIVADSVSTDNNFIAIWDMRDFVFATDPGETGAGAIKSLEEAVTVDNDQLIALDVWMSTSSPGVLMPGYGQGFNDANTLVATADSGLSSIEVGYQTELFGGTGPAITGTVPGNIGVELTLPSVPPGLTIAGWVQGRAGVLSFSGSQVDLFDGSDVLESVYALQTNPIRLTYFFEPNALGDDDDVDSLSFRPWMRILSFTTAEGLAIAGTIRVHRVAVTAYDLPNEPDPSCN